MNKSRELTPQDRRYIDMRHNQRMTFGAIGKQEGLSRERISQILKRAGCRCKIISKRKQRLIDSLKDGRAADEIASETGYGIDSVRSVAKRVGVSLQPYYRKGSYTDKELLSMIRQFKEDNGRLPVIHDFYHATPDRPSFNAYCRRFGTWGKAKKLAFSVD